MRAFHTDTTREYYKYQDVDWTQPTLTSNGTMGGSSMAVSIVWNGYNYNYGTPYTIFVPNNGQAGFYCDEWKSSMYVNIYIPVPLKLTSISFSIVGTGDGADGAAYNVHLWGGNSINNRLEEVRYIGDTWGGTFTSSTSNYYQYFTLYLENGGWAYEDKVTIMNIKLNGSYRTIVAGTPSSYDFYKEIVTVDTPILKEQHYGVKDN